MTLSLEALHCCWLKAHIFVKNCHFWRLSSAGSSWFYTWQLVSTTLLLPSTPGSWIFTWRVWIDQQTCTWNPGNINEKHNVSHILSCLLRSEDRTFLKQRYSSLCSNLQRSFFKNSATEKGILKLFCFLMNLLQEKPVNWQLIFFEQVIVRVHQCLLLSKSTQVQKHGDVTHANVNNYVYWPWMKTCLCHHPWELSQ